MKERGYLAAVSIENDSAPFLSARYTLWALTSALAFETAWS